MPAAPPQRLTRQLGAHHAVDVSSTAGPVGYVQDDEHVRVWEPSLLELNDVTAGDGHAKDVVLEEHVAEGPQLQPWFWSKGRE